MKAKNRPWRNPKRYTVHTGRRCHGCHESKLFGLWGDWCRKCNTTRIEGPQTMHNNDETNDELAGFRKTGCFSQDELVEKQFAQAKQDIAALTAQEAADILQTGGEAEDDSPAPQVDLVGT